MYPRLKTWMNKMKGVRRYKLPIKEHVSHEDVIYSTVNIVNNIVLRIWKLLREYILKSSHHKRKIMLYIWNKYYMSSMWVSCSIVSHSLQPHGLSLGFSRQEYWSGLPFPPPRDLPHPGIEPTFPVAPALADEFCCSLLLEPPGRPHSSGSFFF